MAPAVGSVRTALRRRQALPVPALGLALILLLVAHQALAFGTGMLSIDTRNGPRSFTIEIANDEAEREQGLMNRDALAPDHGMLFIFDTVRPVAMWMKDTRIPLDMLFIAADGHIAQIATMTTPYSLDIIEGRAPVRAVLEIKGGEAARQGITVGDKVQHKAFDSH